MRKLHWVSLALIAAPVVLMHACGGDDTSPAPTTSTGGSGGTGGSATGGSGGSSTGGSGGSATGGSAGTGGSATGGTGGTAGSGGMKDGGGTGGTSTSDAGDAAKGDTGLTDSPSSTDAPGDAGGSKTCTDPAAYMDSGIGLSCNDYCKTFMDVCNSDPILGDSGAFYANEGDCRSKCNAFSQAQLCCYAVHVNNAEKFDGGTRSAHCTHAAGAAGQNVCPAHP